MSTLTQNERDGLDDVFLSIHTPTDRYKKFKELSSLVMEHEGSYNLLKLIKQAKYGLKETKLSQYFLNLSKKKN